MNFPLAHLQTHGHLSPAALARAQAAGEGRLDRALLALGLVSEEVLLEAYGAVLSLPRLSLAAVEQAQPAGLDELNPAFLRRHRLLPLHGGQGAQADAGITVLLADPLDDQARAAIRFALDCEPACALMPGREIETLLDRHLPREEADAATDTAPDLLEGDAERLRDLASEGPVVRQVNELVQRALSLQATDIHVDPMADRLLVRYRIDGLLRETTSLPRRGGPIRACRRLSAWRHGDFPLWQAQVPT